MTQEKMRKMITAIVVAATMLLFILLSVLIYQWITIGVYNKRIAEAEAAIEYYTEQNAAYESDLEYYESDFYKDLAAFKLGLIKGQGK